MSLQPVSVALKFGFLAVLYLFLLWVARSALRDVRKTGVATRAAPPADATGLYSATAPARGAGAAPCLIVERAVGHEPGMIYDLDDEAVLGRGGQADIRIDDRHASSRHARIYEHGNIMVIEDLRSTNGTYLNEELLEGPSPLHPGDRIRVGESEFTFEDA